MIQLTYNDEYRSLFHVTMGVVIISHIQDISMGRACDPIVSPRFTQHGNIDHVFSSFLQYIEPTIHGGKCRKLCAIPRHLV